jgi:GTP-binding protein
MDGLKLMDLPGLIEGTFDGKGLGIKFKKHAETARLVAHFLSLESQDIIGDYNLIRNELVKISEKLVNLPELIVLTKSDLVDEGTKEKQLKTISKLDRKVIVTSAYDFDSLQNLKLKLKSCLK